MYGELLLPGLLGFGASMVCPVSKNSGAYVAQRPPPYVFGVVWPLLYLLIGYSLKVTNDTLVKKLFGVQIFLLTLWPVVFSDTCGNDVKSALYLLPIIIGVTVGIMALHDKKMGVVVLIPLLSWCMLAYLLNWEIV